MDHLRYQRKASDGMVFDGRVAYDQMLLYIFGGGWTKDLEINKRKNLPGVLSPFKNKTQQVSVQISTFSIPTVLVKHKSSNKKDGEEWYDAKSKEECGLLGWIGFGTLTGHTRKMAKNKPRPPKGFEHHPLEVAGMFFFF